MSPFLFLYIQQTSDTPHYENVPFEVPSSWVWTTLQNISTIIGDGLHGTPQYDNSGDYYFINGNNLSEHKIKIKEDTKRVSENEYLKYRKPLNETSILVSINGTIGNVGTYNSERVILGKSACYFNISPLLHKVYFCYLLESDYFLKYAFESATGSTIKNVPLKAMNDFFVPLPPLAEQQRIIAEIEKRVSLINQIEQGKADLQTVIKQTKSKILDLAIHGKLVPQDPTDKPASELLKRINPKAEITCDNGQYGKVPEEWSLCKLGDIGEIVTGSTPTKNISEYYGGIIPFYKPADLENGICVKAASDHLSILGYEQARKIPAYSILVTCIGATIGKTGLIIVEGSCNQQINAIIPNEATYAKFIYYTCISDYMQKEIKLNASATTLPILNKGNFAKLLFPLPPLAEQHRIVAKIEELFSYLDNIQKALEV